MKSKKAHEGYLLIDHRNSPGIPEIIIPGIGQVITAPEGKVLELSILVCKHCQAEVVLHPQRTRERGYCPNCDHYICDRCEAIRKIHGCQTIDKVFDDILESTAKSQNIVEI